MASGRRPRRRAPATPLLERTPIEAAAAPVAARYRLQTARPYRFIRTAHHQSRDLLMASAGQHAQTDCGRLRCCGSIGLRPHGRGRRAG